MGRQMIAAALLACAVNVAPITLEAVMRVESGGNPLALNVNHLGGPQPRPHDADEAARLARRYIDAGYRVDIGLLQIDSSNLSGLGLTVEQAMDPCMNIHGGARILTSDYTDAARIFGDGQTALKVALSEYNTGDARRGFENGYVARYYGATAVPALAGGVLEAREIAAVARQGVAPDPYTAATEIAFMASQR